MQGLLVRPRRRCHSPSTDQEGVRRGHRGNEKKFVCPYHGWTYDLGGNLVAARSMTEGFAKEEHSLHSVPLEVIGGLLFACFCDSPPSLADAQRDLAEPIAWFDFKNLKVAAQKTYPIASNWKLAIGFPSRS